MRFDSTDFQLTKLVGVLSAVAATTITVVVPIVQWVQGEPLVAVVDTTTAIANPAPGVTVTQGPQTELEFAAPTAMQWLVSLIPAALFVGLLVTAVWLLWRLFDDVRAGQPFSRTNVRRLRGIASVIVFGGKRATPTCSSSTSQPSRTSSWWGWASCWPPWRRPSGGASSWKTTSRVSSDDGRRRTPPRCLPPR